jgi:hypothetical protein
MTYFMRFIYKQGEPITLAELQAALQQHDDQFVIHADAADEESGDLMRGEDVYGELELNTVRDAMFQEDVQELTDQIDGVHEPAAPYVRNMLADAVGMVVLRVAEMGHYNAERLDVLWDWLFTQRDGVLQVDGEGYYDADRLILPVTDDE